MRRNPRLIAGAMSLCALACGGALTQALSKDESADVRQFAALALGRIGPAAAAAIPTLEAAEQDPDRTVANAARSALRQISPDISTGHEASGREGV